MEVICVAGGEKKRKERKGGWGEMFAPGRQTRKKLTDLLPAELNGFCQFRFALEQIFFLSPFFAVSAFHPRSFIFPSTPVPNGEKEPLLLLSLQRVKRVKRVDRSLLPISGHYFSPIHSQTIPTIKFIIHHKFEAFSDTVTHSYVPSSLSHSLSLAAA